MAVNYEDLELKKLNYNSYLKIPEILSLQVHLSSPPHHDEMFFIIIHQTAELWFKEMLHETNNLIRFFREGEIAQAVKTLKRITAIMDLQVKQINLLATLTPVEFAGFRNLLRPASGFQSYQFRELEFTYGLRETFFLKFFKQMPEVVARLEKALHQPSVYDECLSCLKNAGFHIPEELFERDFSEPWKLNTELVATIRDIYNKPASEYHWVLLFETMLDFDEKVATWRSVHILMVSRTIGQKQGTGGSAGFDFLTTRAPLRFFPELWEVRNHLGD